jgi:serine protein kinase
MAELNIFERVIKADRAGAARELRQWRGTLLDYLELVKNDAIISKMAHARIYDMIVLPGLRNINYTDDSRTKRLYKDEPINVYNFFADEFFGIEKTIAQLVRYFHSASLKGEESRQVLYLMGPVGSGKSSLVERIGSVGMLVEKAKGVII